MRTKDDVEIDLIIDRPHQSLICIEIKSATKVRPEDISKFVRVTKEMKNTKCYCFSNDPSSKKIEHVDCLHWQEGLRELHLGVPKGRHQRK